MGNEYQIPNLVLDEIDKQILTILHEEGRISYTDLGKRVELSRVAVQSRINQLIEAGVIEKFTAVINPAKIGIHVSVFFNVEVEPQFLEEVALKLEEEPAVTSLYHMTGPSKLHMHGIFADDQEMEEFLTKRLYPLQGVVSVDCQMLIKRYKSRMGMKL
ncbi:MULTISPECIES: chromate efflux transcriptional regulator ChrS [Bacillus]|jgi:DNA-binding Lrp family transcriptional regulator|uniref:AsnC family transcriptional regulator associated with chromate transportation system n=1 Tax=Bacillus mojavensis TaxID=72360 RepID=A0AAP3G2N2_BACMO|nr:MULTISPECIES: chromate efflux transcriptional regulator ChrS [Bacillus]MCC2931180.1 chromate efflux transcriptional regulator ChrS [Bacillus sp. LBG-1-113]MCY8510967.1 chromate efflux transcriptional regulator ChrS [Bacillus mojavensis]MCY9090028.1 chromate efflux transcriptional regulator ChrS [Bacillus mojavensis]MCY9188076.1 chromate efflux transcriptional regulator ChrS [Bacillus mojavensis]MDR4228769.1 Lrp/AsnC family transcriptional regulator [Bacillus mojavensis]